MSNQIEIKGRLYPKTARRCRQWRRDVLLPLIEQQTRQRGLEKAAEKAEARRRREAELAASRTRSSQTSRRWSW